MRNDDEAISKMYQFSLYIKGRRFADPNKVRHEIHRMSHLFYTGNISPIEYYKYCLDVIQDYVSRISFQTSKIEEIEIYFDSLMQNELEFNDHIERREKRPVQLTIAFFE